MSRQEHFRRLYKKLNPAWQDCLELYIKIISEHAGPETKLLDIGCGHADWLKDVYACTPHVYGHDPDADAVAQNSIIKHKSVGTTDALPYPDGFFDLVVCAFVLEHLKDPTTAFNEISRVLKPGGKFIFLTPNSWNYTVWLICLIPEVLHHPLNRCLYGRGDNDTYRKYYRANSVSKLAGLASRAGLSIEHMIYNGDPTYIGFNRPLFFIANLIERLFDYPYFNKYRVHLIGIAKQKTGF